MADEFYYLENGTQQGPVDRDSLVAVLTSRLTSETLVWRDGMAEWLPANQLPELAPALSTRPMAAAGPSAGAGAAPSLNPITVFRRSFSWTGTFNRGELIVAILTNWVVGMILGTIIAVLAVFDSQSVAVIVVASLLGLVWIVIMTIAGLGIQVRRVHDLGVTPWMILLSMVPFANLVWFVYLFAAPGKPDAPKVQPVPVAPIAVVIAIVALAILAMAAAIAIPAFVAARQRAKGINMQAVSKSVSEGLRGQLSLDVATVACPTETRAMKAGDVFECVATPAVGGRLTVAVTQQDDHGNVNWKVSKTEGLIDLQVVEQSVVKGLKEQANVDATVACGG
jgi:uncharacterized membrane protein YhaH (DUF805 family)